VFQRQPVLAAACHLAVVDDEMGDAAQIEQPLRVVRHPAIAAVEDQPAELDMLGLFGHHQMPVTAIDDPRRARHAG